jgi:hypothetical protein
MIFFSRIKTEERSSSRPQSFSGSAGKPQREKFNFLLNFKHTRPSVTRDIIDVRPSFRAGAAQHS